MLERLFHLKESGTDIKTESIAGITTFLTLSYIIFVQPAILGAAGMDQGAVFVAGVLFILLSAVGLREALVNNIPGCLKNAIPVGIGLLIALVGLEWSGIVVSHPVTYVTLGDLTSTPTALSLFGLVVISSLIALRFKGAILAGFILTTVVGLFIGLVEYKGIINTPPSIDPTLFKLEIPNIIAYPNLITVIIIFFFLDLFDSIGTLIGVTQQAGIMKDDKLPKAKECLLSDAVATSAGAVLGTSSVTAYIESAAGISVGGKTGLTNVVTALLMILALFFSLVGTDGRFRLPG